MKRQIMKSLAALCTGVMTLCAASFFTACDKFDDTQLQNEIAGLKTELGALDARLQAIESLKTDLAALTARVDALYTLQFQVSSTNELQYSFDGKTWTGTKIILASQTTVKFKVSDKNELMYSEDNGTTWKGSGITLAQECKKALSFKVDGGKVLYTLDGTKWEETGATVVDPCENPAIEFVDNEDGTVTIKIGDASIVINKPEEIVFEIKAGKVYFASEATQTVSIKTSGIEDLTVMAAPKGWFAEINADGQIEVTAPNIDDVTTYDWNGEVDQQGTAAATGYVKVHACSEDGKCLVGRLSVEVSEEQVIASSYAGKYYVSHTDENSEVYFGMSPKETYMEDAQALIEALNEDDYDVMNAWEGYAAPAADGDIAELLGSEPEVGKEYVLWAIDPYNAPDLTMNDLVLSYYSPIKVTAVENESKRTPFDNYIDVTIEGAYSYYVLAVPAEMTDRISMYISNMIDVGYGSYGKQLKENYSGSFYRITEGTDSYVGEGTPSSTGTLLVLPIDGRPTDSYTADDVWDFTFTTGELVAGGSFNAVAEGFTTNDYWTLNTYTKLGVVLDVPEGNWKNLYFMWMTEEEYGTGADEALVETVTTSLSSTIWEPYNVESETSNGAVPLMITENVDPGTVKYFVGFYVDSEGKYGTVAKVRREATSLVQSSITLDPTTNLTGDVLLNKTTLEVTLAPSESASKYKYIWCDVTANYYNPYSGYSESQLYNGIHFGEGISGAATAVKTVDSADLTGDKLVFEGNVYGHEYWLAVLPYDAAGNPGQVVEVFEYECLFELGGDDVETSSFGTTEPTVDYNVPDVLFAVNAFMNNSVSFEFPEYSYYYQDWGDMVNIGYDASYKVTPEEGTEVLTLFVDAEGAEAMGDDAVERTNALWNKTLNANSIKTSTEEKTWDAEGSGSTDAAPVYYILVSWKDSEGNYYYKEVDLTTQFNTMYAALNTALTAAHPDNVQLTLPVDEDSDFATEMMPVTKLVLDLGVSKEGHMELGYDAWEAYMLQGATEEQLEQMGLPKEYMGTLTMGGFGVPYVVIPSSATEGVIRMFKASMADNTSYVDIPYSGYSDNETAFNIDATAMLLSTVVATPVSENVTFYNPMSEVGGGEEGGDDDGAGVMPFL